MTDTKEVVVKQDLTPEAQNFNLLNRKAKADGRTDENESGVGGSEPSHHSG
jgi:hypothetical protein